MEAPQATVVRYRQVLAGKPVLRKLYLDWYCHMKRMLSDASPTVEVGTGHGLMAEILTDVIRSDVFPSPYTDLSCDAMNLPFHDESVGNFVMLDVIHHIERPMRAFVEFSRCLKEGGRIVAAEPYLSPFAKLLFKFHFEEVDFSQELGSLKELSSSSDSNPFEGNMALSHKALVTHTNELLEHIPSLRLIRREISDHIVYPLSGGFNFPSLVPLWSLSGLQALERWTNFLSSLAGFRIIAVFEKY
jgi:SAM-dependent methyltransferase